VTYASVFPFPLAPLRVAAPGEGSRDAPASDAELVRRILSDDRGAFDELVARFHRIVFAIAYRMTGSRPEAEDLCQDVFLRVFRNLDRFDPARPLGPWVRKIACNGALHHLRRRGLERRHAYAPRPSTEDGEILDPAATVADRAPDPEAALAAKEMDARIQAALLSFPEKPRLAFTLKYVEGLTATEIAEALDVPRNTVKTWLLRARETLRRELGHAE
jgi:RNA polymerase sigma-70 factor (ECF subfamily)